MSLLPEGQKTTTGGKKLPDYASPHWLPSPGQIHWYQIFQQAGDQLLCQPRKGKCQYSTDTDDPAYFSLEAVDHVTAQIKSGKARTLDGAYAQYELSRYR